MNKHELELEKLKEELSILRNVQQTAMLGWWRVNFSTNTYYFSDYLRNLTNLDRNEMSFEEFRALLDPDYREKIIRNGTQFNETGIYEEKFRVMTKFGYRWVDSKLGKKEINDKGEVYSLGYLRFMDESEIEMLEHCNSEVENKEHIVKNSIIFTSLMELLYKNGSDTAIEKTLNDILEILKGDRVYIFEYDKNKEFQSCVYEVCSPVLSAEKAILQNVPVHVTPWWSHELLHKIPIISNGLHEIPEEAIVEKAYLKKQKIDSLMVVPLISHEQTMGYIGIDIVDRHRIWSKLEKQLFLSISNIISLCIELKYAIKTAEAEQKRFVNLFEHMPMGFLKGKVIYDEKRNPIDYLLIEANSSVEKITKTSKETYIGKLGSEVDGIYLKERLHFFDSILKSSSALSEVAIASESDLYYAYTAYASENDEFNFIFHDNTESLSTRHDLVKNRAKLNKIFQNVPVGIEIYDKEGVLMEINDADIKIFGVVREEVVGKINLFNNPNVPKQYLSELKKGNNIDIGLSYDYNKVIDLKYFPTTHTNSKHLAVKSTILYDKNNETESIILVIADNTETITANDKIRQFELIFNSMSEIAAIGLSRYNITKDEFVVTDQWCTNLCKTQKEVGDFAKTYSNLYSDDLTLLATKFEELRDRKLDDFKSEIRVHDGIKDKWVKSFYKVSNENVNTGEVELIGLNIDITAQKNTEKKLIAAKTNAEESDRLKSAFVANMSHEIRTPLNAIIGFSNIVTEIDDIEERKQYISIIKQNNDLLLQLISDILDLSRIESGIISYTSEIVDVNLMCEEIVRTHTMKAPKEVHLLFERPIDFYLLETDKNKLIQILANLIANAIKFTTRGEIKMGYRIEDEQIIFYVKDSGIGIDKKQIPLIFDRFVKLNNFVQGTGLGLPICRSLADKLGGHIWVESELGRGSCFWLSLPNTQ